MLSISKGFSIKSQTYLKLKMKSLPYQAYRKAAINVEGLPEDIEDVANKGMLGIYLA
jgi:hypothetical protein